MISERQFLCDPAPVPDWSALRAADGPFCELIRLGSSPELVRDNAAGLAYLAAPYAGVVHIRNAWRMDRSVRLSAMASIEVTRLAMAGVTAVCPAVQIAEMCHAGSMLAERPDPLDCAFWTQWSWPLLNCAKVVVVPDFDGWDRCPQVWSDVRHALRYNLPVHLYAGAA